MSWYHFFVFCSRIGLKFDTNRRDCLPHRPRCSPNRRDLCRTLEILLRASPPPPRSLQSLRSAPQRGPRLPPLLPLDVEAAVRPCAKLFGFAPNSSGSVTSRPVRSPAHRVRSTFDRTHYKKKVPGPHQSGPDAVWGGPGTFFFVSRFGPNLTEPCQLATEP